MAINSNGWKGWVLGVVAVLAAYGVQGTVRTAIAQNVNEAEIAALKRQQITQGKQVNAGLEKIDQKLDKIADAVGEIAVDAAKSHHDHPR